jgi:hypothetical protein
MTTAEILVLVGAAVVLAGPAWFFFGPRRAHSTRTPPAISTSPSPHRHHDHAGHAHH